MFPLSIWSLSFFHLSLFFFSKFFLFYLYFLLFLFDLLLTRGRIVSHEVQKHSMFYYLQWDGQSLAALTVSLYNTGFNDFALDKTFKWLMLCIWKCQSLFPNLFPMYLPLIPNTYLDPCLEMHSIPHEPVSLEVSILYLLREIVLCQTAAETWGNQLQYRAHKLRPYCHLLVNTSKCTINHGLQYMFFCTPIEICD